MGGGRDRIHENGEGGIYFGQGKGLIFFQTLKGC